MPAGASQCLAVEMRNLVTLLGDQLELSVATLDSFDCSMDAARLAEPADESTRVGSSKPRTAMPSAHAPLRR